MDSPLNALAKARAKADRDMNRALASVRAWAETTPAGSDSRDEAVEVMREVSSTYATWRRAAYQPLRP